MQAIPPTTAPTTMTMTLTMTMMTTMTAPTATIVATDDLALRLQARLAECQARVVAVHPGFPTVVCSLFSRRRAAGLAFGNEHRIGINEVLLRENPDQMLRDTVAHEFAHVVVWWRHLERRKVDPAAPVPSAHGAEWQSVMRDVFAVEPSRCHRFDTSNTGARVQRRWEYRCRCQAHLLTTSKHNRAQSGAQYVCRDCKTELAVHVFGTAVMTGVAAVRKSSSPPADLVPA